MKIANNIEVPDKCPDNCEFVDEFRNYGQNAICGRCPVFCCVGPDPLLPPEEYRMDWAIEWKKFFDGKGGFLCYTFLEKNTDE